MIFCTDIHGLHSFSSKQPDRTASMAVGAESRCKSESHHLSEQFAVWSNFQLFFQTNIFVRCDVASSGY